MYKLHMHKYFIGNGLNMYKYFLENGLIELPLVCNVAVPLLQWFHRV